VVIKVGIYGASGYTGQELIRIISRHPTCELTQVTSRRYAGVKLSDLFPHLRGFTDLAFINADPHQVAETCEVVFLAVPHGVAMSVAGTFLDAGVKVIDLSADFRIRKAEIYEKWYKTHEAKSLLSSSVYGLPELYRNEIRTAKIVANPGCYPTSVILGIAPLLTERWIDPSSIIVDSKSGVSGAGREPVVSSLFCEVGEAFKAYKVGGAHRHIPEIEQELSQLAGEEIKITFTPHLLPVSRGILSTIYTQPVKPVSRESLYDLYKNFYRSEPFIRIYPPGEIPNISAVRGSNFCDIGLVIDGRANRIIVLSAIDNLIKGASGQAVQNMNLMCAIDERAGLQMVPLYP